MRWSFLPTVALVAASSPAHAVQYLSVEQAQVLLFPTATEFRAMELLLTDTQRRAVSEASGVRAREARVRVWSARDGQGRILGRVYLDEVTGKHDLITYAVGVDGDGRVGGIEVLDYRENYGGQIRESGWRGQFRGKTARDPLKLDADIANISGATLSCSHVADGVRRLLATNELLFKATAN